MANITLSIPDILYKKMKNHTEVRWSEIVRQIIQKRLEDFELMEKLVSKSKLTEKDSFEIGEKIKEGIWKRFKQAAKAK